VVLPVGGEVGGVIMDELIETIKREFYSFDVLQLVAVIEELLEYGGGRIFFEVDADLSFPPSDVGYAGIDGDGDGATVRLPVMNLLGSSSPLPIGFSDHIARGRPDADLYADFLSILQNRLHSLWMDAYRKNALWGGGGAVAKKVFGALTGLSAETGDQMPPPHIRDCGCADVAGANRVRQPSSKRNAGFLEFALAGFWPLLNRTRSAQGLKELLSAVFGDIPIYIEGNAGRWAAVSNARPLGGGARLGKNAAVGTRVYDKTSKFRVTVGPLDYRTYEAFMPDGSFRRLINEVVSVYLNEPVICEIAVTCKLRDLPMARLGGERTDGINKIGRTAVLGTGGRGTAAVSWIGGIGW